MLALGSSVTEHERRDAGTAGLGGFDAGSAASDVLAGIDLTGSTAVVTGSTPARLETTRALTAAEVEVVVGARRPGIAREAVRGMDRVEVFDLDPDDLASVRHGTSLDLS